MSYYDYDYDLPTLDDVDDVSTMRHYINCTGDYKGVAKKYHTTVEMVEDIYDCFRGPRDLAYLVKHFDEEYAELQEEEDNKQKAYEKNVDLISDLEKKRDTFCGLGTRKVKLLLNKKMKEGDKVAQAYRLALEAEDKNICAKKIRIEYQPRRSRYYRYSYNYTDYAEKTYELKHKIVGELIKLCQENDFIYGYEDSDNYSANTVIYFELPDMEQISFHDTLTKEEKDTLKIYKKPWDGKINSTLDKIEEAINKRYADEIATKKVTQ